MKLIRFKSRSLFIFFLIVATLCLGYKWYTDNKSYTGSREREDLEETISELRGAGSILLYQKLMSTPTLIGTDIDDIPMLKRFSWKTVSDERRVKDCLTKELIDTSHLDEGTRIEEGLSYLPGDQLLLYAFCDDRTPSVEGKTQVGFVVYVRKNKIVGIFRSLMYAPA